MSELHAWHFLRADRKLGYKDQRVAKVGETLTVEGPLVICERGLHGSPRAIDALNYAPGPIACRVVLGGEVLMGTEGNADKACATERTVVAMVDATDILREFIRDTLVFRQPHMVTLFERVKLQEHARALRALEMETASWEDIQAVCNAARDATWVATWAATWAATWDAARDAAWAATWDAARDAAWAATRDAAWAATRDATLDAARAATRDAARAATRDAARDATWAAARAATRDAARDATWAATRDAAWDAARDAARDSLNARLEARLLEAMAVRV